MVLIGGQPYDLSLAEIRDDAFKASTRPARLPKNQLVIHESVTHDADIIEGPDDKDDVTERILRRKGCGVHFMIAPLPGHTDKATMTTHGDLLDRLNHAGKLNAGSVAIEIVNPYYPKHRKPSGPWTEVIKARWAHRGRYVLPTPGQMARLWEVVFALTAVCLNGLEIPREFVGLRDDKMCMGRLPGRDLEQGGVWAHHYDNHADGAFPALYCALRDRGLSASRAYEAAVDLAERARGGWTPELHKARVSS